LSCPCLSKVVDNLLVRVCLLNVMIVEVNYGVTIWEDFSLNPIIEYHFLLPVLVDSLDLAVMANYLLNDLHIA